MYYLSYACTTLYMCEPLAYSLILMLVNSGHNLQAWSPPDPSAHALLSPWKEVWKLSEWRDITSRTVVPALETAMHHVLNLFPHPVERFNITPCEWCAVWADMLSQKQLAGESLNILMIRPNTADTVIA